MNSINCECRKRNGIPSGSALFLDLSELFLVLLFFLWLPGYGQETPPVQRSGMSQEGQKVPLGSLSGMGDVYVNDLPAPAESTVFSGDKVRTAPTGTATFTMSGNGTLKISPESQVAFPGTYLFTAELDTGTVVLNSMAGGKGITLRMKDFVLVPSFPREQSVTSTVERTPDGSFVVSCSDGSAGVLTLQGRSGQFLHAGQTLRVSFNAEKAELTPAFSGGRRSEGAVQRLDRGWLLLGLAGAGGVAFAIDQLAQGGGKQPVSPSAP